MRIKLSENTKQNVKKSVRIFYLLFQETYIILSVVSLSTNNSTIAFVMYLRIAVVWIGKD